MRFFSEWFQNSDKWYYASLRSLALNVQNIMVIRKFCHNFFVYLFFRLQQKQEQQLLPTFENRNVELNSAIIVRDSIDIC